MWNVDGIKAFLRNEKGTEMHWKEEGIAPAFLFMYSALSVVVNWCVSAVTARCDRLMAVLIL